MSEPRYGAYPEEWECWAHTLGLQRELLPSVANPHATISPKSVLKSGAKVPSRYTRDREVVGIPKWNEGRCLDSDLEEWSREEDYAICLQTRLINAFDVDIADAETVAWIDAVLAPYGMPRRWRSNSAKCLYLYQPQTPSKKRVLKTQDGGMIELLGLGNQCLVSGCHPSGVRYAWDPFTSIPMLNDETVVTILETLKHEVGLKGKDWSRGAAVPKNVLDPGAAKRRKAERAALMAAKDALGTAVVEAASLTINGVSIPLLPDGSAVLSPLMTMPALNPNLAVVGAKLAALDAEIARDEAYAAMGPDPMVEYLHEHGFVKGEGEGGLLYVTCPFELNHGKTGDDSQTVYFPAGTGGYMRGHVKCLDGACGAYSDVDFLVGWGWTRYEQMQGFVDEGPSVAPVHVWPPLPHEVVERPAAVLDALGVGVDATPDATAHPLLPASCLNGLYAEKGGIRQGRGETHLPLTDAGMADRFVALFGHRIRYVTQTKEWLIWTDRWLVDSTKGLMIEYVRRLDQVLAHEAIDLVQQGLTTDAKTVLEWKLKVQTLAAFESTLTLTSVKPTIALHITSLDAHPFRVGFDEGRQLLDLETGVCRRTVPSDYVTKSLSVSAIGESSKATRWHRFLHEVFAGDQELIAWIQRFCGYGLSASTREQIFLFLHGSGANGKSVFVNILKAIMSDYASAIQSSTLTQSIRNAQGASPDIVAMVGRRLVMAPETEEGSAMAESLVKSLTGGDTVATRQLNCAQFQFTPQFKLIINGNHKLMVKGTDAGIWRRLRLIPFRVSFLGREDHHLEATLRAEAPHIVAWMAEGARLWITQGLGAMPQTVKLATTQYATEMDTLGEFLDEYCEFGDPMADGMFISVQRLFGFFTAWLQSCQRRTVSLQSFTRKMGERAGVTAGKRKGDRVYFGVRIQEEKLKSEELWAQTRR